MRGDELFFLLDVSLLGFVVLLVLLFVEFVLEEIVLKGALVSRDHAVLEAEDDLGDLLEEGFVVADD